MIPLKSFTPDFDPATPGAVLDCSNMMPTLKGLSGAPSLVDSGYAALSEASKGAALCVKLDGTNRSFVGTSTKIWEAVGGSWTDRTRAVGGAYSASSDDVRWRFAQFGDTSLAVQKADFLQYSNSGAFANVTAPKAACIETVAGFVMLANCNDTGAGLGTAYGDQTNRWWCSAYNDYSTWTPSVTTQATTGLLVDSPGAITGLKRLGSDVVVYKSRSMYMGRYVGAPVVWQWALIPGEVGCASQEAVVSIGSAHLFVGYEDFYLFDGTRPVPIGAPVREWFFANLNKPYRYRITALHDLQNSRVWWFYPSTSSSSGAPDKAIIYNYKSQTWGAASYGIESAVDFVSSGVTYANIGNYWADYAGLPSISYDSPFWSASNQIMTVFQTDHKPWYLTGASTSSSVTTGDVGDDYQFSTIKQARLRYQQAPTTAAMTNYYRLTSGISLTQDATTTETSGRFDVLRSSRWHRLKFYFTGPVELIGMTLEAQNDGTG